MLPILLAKYGGPQKFDPILGRHFPKKPHNINHNSDRERDELFVSGIRFSIAFPDLKIF